MVHNLSCVLYIPSIIFMNGFAFNRTIVNSVSYNILRIFFEIERKLGEGDARIGKGQSTDTGCFDDVFDGDGVNYIGCDALECLESSATM